MTQTTQIDYSEAPCGGCGTVGGCKCGDKPVLTPIKVSIPTVSSSEQPRPIRITSKDAKTITLKDEAKNAKKLAKALYENVPAYFVSVLLLEYKKLDKRHQAFRGAK